ncbi:gamma-glutamyl ligase [Candidatus Bathyarchaeota archaeon]|nr:MAG: gamma-glutamyl ligase [Candidatus Bathyarchaeota archaeon]
MRIRAVVIRTDYWRPGTDYVRTIVEAVRPIVRDGDIVTVSEKAISVARGLIIDESRVRPSLLAKFLSEVWMRRIWGGPLGRITKLRRRTLRRLKRYPVAEGAAHKEAALRYVGLLQALRHYSEGGIDASNLPYSYVSLPLRDGEAVATEIRGAIERETGRRVTVMIVNGDTTYSFRNLHLAPRHLRVRGFVHLGGFLTFVVGRTLGLRRRSTPIAISGGELNPDLALTLADIAHKIRGYGAGRTVWDMARRFKVGITGVTWEMLESVVHRPIVVLRIEEERI